MFEFWLQDDTISKSESLSSKILLTSSSNWSPVPSKQRTSVLGRESFSVGDSGSGTQTDLYDPSSLSVISRRGGWSNIPSAGTHGTSESVTVASDDSDDVFLRFSPCAQV